MAARDYLVFFIRNWRLLLFGLILMALSSAGQIFFVALYGGEFRSTFNITDGTLVSKKEFISTAAREAGYKIPTGSVPLGVAKALTTVCEGAYRLLKKKEAPLLSKARFKFLGLNLAKLAKIEPTKRVKKTAG